MTPNGAILQDIVSFANEWKTQASCTGNVEYSSVMAGTCVHSTELKKYAEQKCNNVLRSGKHESKNFIL